MLALFIITSPTTADTNLAINITLPAAV